MLTIRTLIPTLQHHRLGRILDARPHEVSASAYLDSDGKRDLRGLIEVWHATDRLTLEPTDPLPAFEDPAYGCEIEVGWAALCRVVGVHRALAEVQLLARDELGRRRRLAEAPVLAGTA